MSHDRILLAEKDVLVAMDVAAELETAGMTIVGITGSVVQAAELIAEKQPDFALLNVSLRDGPSFPVARRLRALGIPFAFLTGYEKNEIDPEFKNVPCLTKPRDTQEIVTSVAALLQHPPDDARSRTSGDEADGPATP